MLVYTQVAGAELMTNISNRIAWTVTAIDAAEKTAGFAIRTGSPAYRRLTE